MYNEIYRAIFLAGVMFSSFVVQVCDFVVFTLLTRTRKPNRSTTKIVNASHAAGFRV